MNFECCEKRDVENIQTLVLRDKVTILIKLKQQVYVDLSFVSLLIYFSLFGMTNSQSVDNKVKNHLLIIHLCFVSKYF